MKSIQLLVPFALVFMPFTSALPLGIKAPSTAVNSIETAIMSTAGAIVSANSAAVEKVAKGKATTDSPVAKRDRWYEPFDYLNNSPTDTELFRVQNGKGKWCVPKMFDAARPKYHHHHNKAIMDHELENCMDIPFLPRDERGLWRTEWNKPGPHNQGERFDGKNVIIY